MLGPGLVVYGVLRSAEWGWLFPRPGSPSLFGVSATVRFAIVGLLVVWLFLQWEGHVIQSGGDPLVRPSLLRNAQLVGGLTMFFFQFMAQAGLFFVVSLFLSVVLELSAITTGVRLLPLSVGLILSAAGVPKVRPKASPRRVVRIGLLLILGGILGLLSGITLDASAAVVGVPLALIGLGVGCLASQLGAVTASAVPSEQGGEVDGLQNTAMNLGRRSGRPWPVPC